MSFFIEEFESKNLSILREKLGDSYSVDEDSLISNFMLEVDKIQSGSGKDGALELMRVFLSLLIEPKTHKSIIGAILYYSKIKFRRHQNAAKIHSIVSESLENNCEVADYIKEAGEYASHQRIKHGSVPEFLQSSGEHNESTNFSYTDNFQTVTINRETYSLTKSQSKMVEALYTARTVEGHIELREEEILRRMGRSDGMELRDLFRRRKNNRFSSIVVKGSKPRTYKLKY